MAQTIEEFTEGWLLSKVEGVPYSESIGSPGSPEEEFRNDGSRVQRTVYCPWRDRFKLIRDFIGYPVVQNTGSALYISRITPDAYQDHLNTSNRPFLYCTQAQRVLPVGLPEPQPDGTFKLYGPKNIADYFLAKVTFLYETLTYDVFEDEEVSFAGVPDEAAWSRYVTVLPSPSVKGINLPLVGAGNTAHYVADANSLSNFAADNVVPGQPVKLEKRTDLVCIWHDVPQQAIGMREVNPAANSFPIDDALGKVNSDDFPAHTPDPLHPPGTLLLLSCKPTPVRSAHGDRTYNLEFRISYVDFGIKTMGGVDVHLGHQALLQVVNGATPPAAYREVSFDPADPTPSNLVAKAQGVNIYDWAPYQPMFRVPV